MFPVKKLKLEDIYCHTHWFIIVIFFINKLTQRVLDITSFFFLDSITLKRVNLAYTSHALRCRSTYVSQEFTKFVGFSKVLFFVALISKFFFLYRSKFFLQSSLKINLNASLDKLKLTFLMPYFLIQVIQ